MSALPLLLQGNSLLQLCVRQKADAFYVSLDHLNTFCTISIIDLEKKYVNIFCLEPVTLICSCFCQ